MTSPTPSAEMEILPCPFCGPQPAMPEVWRDHIGYVRVICGPCGSSSGTRPPSDPDGKAKVIASWNRRPSDPVRAELVEALGDMLRLTEDMARFAGQMALRDYALFNEAPIRARAILTRAEAGSPRPTSTRREVLEEAARVARDHAERRGWLAMEFIANPPAYSEQMTARTTAQSIEADIRVLASEGE